MRPAEGGKKRDIPVVVADEDLADLKEVKVRLPVDQVLRLHYARMKKRKNFSEIVSSALTQYFDDFMKP